MGGAREDCLEVCFVGLVVRGNYICLVRFHFYHIFGIWKSKGVGDALKSLFGWHSKSERRGAILLGKRGEGSYYVILLF